MRTLGLSGSVGDGKQDRCLPFGHLTPCSVFEALRVIVYVCCEEQNALQACLEGRDSWLLPIWTRPELTDFDRYRSSLQVAHHIPLLEVHFRVECDLVSDIVSPHSLYLKSLSSECTLGHSFTVIIIFESGSFMVCFLNLCVSFWITYFILQLLKRGDCVLLQN